MAPQDERLSLQETDDTKNVIATYIFSGPDESSKRAPGGRVDVMVSGTPYSRARMRYTYQLQTLLTILLETCLQGFMAISASHCIPR